MKQSKKKITRRDANGKLPDSTVAGSALRVHKIPISEETRRSLTADVRRGALERIEIKE